jgi:hypothetical protein
LVKKLIVGGVVGGLLLVSSIAGYVIGAWESIPQHVQGPIVSGAFTLLAALAGALVVFWQLGRQAMNTINANKQNERMKLKKQV